MGFDKLTALLDQTLISIKAGIREYPGITTLNKFGRATDVDSSTYADIWDRCNATNTQDVWLPPTQARLHNIVSTSDADDFPIGAGAQLVNIYGLTGWDDLNETVEEIEMNGSSGKTTQNAYVVIYRMRVTQTGSNVAPNTGLITAVAATDGTVTTQINVGEGQTQMAIYAIPSTKTLVLLSKYSSVLKANLGAQEVLVDIKLSVNPEPQNHLLSYTTKHTWGIGSRGGSPSQHLFYPPRVFKGPLIMKISAVASASDTDVSAGFDGYILDNTILGI